MSKSRLITKNHTFKEFILLFWVFFKIGLFTFGGGYAMLSMIEDEVVNRRHWVSREDLMNIFAIAESTPGPIGINTATFIGVKRFGILGGITATLGVVLPSFLVILLVSFIIDLVRDNHWIQVIFMGVRVCVVVLILKAVLSFFKSIKKNLFSFLLVIGSFLVIFLTNTSVIYVVIGAIFISVIAVCIVTYRNNHKFHMIGTPEYYSETAGRKLDKDEYISEKVCTENNIKISREAEK